MWFPSFLSGIGFVAFIRFEKKKDVPYQSLLKVYLAEKVREEVLADNRA